jgi:hypothetical protein
MIAQGVRAEIELVWPIDASTVTITFNGLEKNGISKITFELGAFHKRAYIDNFDHPVIERQADVHLWKWLGFRNLNQVIAMVVFSLTDLASGFVSSSPLVRPYALLPSFSQV